MAEVPDNIAPVFILEVEGSEMGAEVTQFVQSLEYESCDGMADVAKITLSNPDFLLTQSKLFQPYNEMAIWMGYGNDPAFIGRVILVKPRNVFPPGGMPTLIVKGYTKDWHMMQMDPADKKRREARAAAASKAGNKKLAKAIKKINYGDATVHEVIEQIALENMMRSDDIDPVDVPEIGNLDRPADMSDYDFVKCLSNLTGFLFWVDANKKGKWYLHFRNPEATLGTQDKIYTFRYNSGELSTLLSFEPEMLFTNRYTEIKVQVLGWRGGKERKIMEQVVTVDEQDIDSPVFTGDTQEKLKTDMVGAEVVKLYIGDYSFKFLLAPGMQDQIKIKMWAEAWFRRNRENFILGRGRCPGVETLMARQEHNLEGIGKPYDGKYYFSRVNHIMGGRGYSCDFHARKVA